MTLLDPIKNAAEATKTFFSDHTPEMPQNCGKWSKVAGVTSAVALGLIATILAVLCVVALQGSNIGSINAMASYLQAGGTYGMLVGGVLLTGAAATLAACLVRQHLNERKPDTQI